MVICSVAVGCHGHAPAAASGSAATGSAATGSAATGSAATGSAAPIPASPGCEHELATWLAGVTAEDDDMSERITPPLLDVKPSHAPGGAHVEINSDVITLNGSIIAETHDAKIQNGLHAAFAALAPTPLEIHADRETPWSVIALVAHEAQQTGHTRVVFEVVAGHRTAKPPPPSSIDQALAEWDRQFDALPLDQRLGNPPKADFWERVLRDCPGALDVFTHAGSGDDAPAQVIATKMPRAVGACGCHVELPALERLLWRLYGREWAVPHAWFAVDLGAGRAWIERGDTPWAQAAAHLLRDASAAPGPITLGAN